MITTIKSQSTEISTLDALWTLYQSQSKKVRQALAKRILEEHKLHQTQAQQQMVKESLTRAFDDLHSGKVRHDARKLFK
ncbi:hypothetical protein [Prevotella sp. P6B1]|uniref:hypothetical protein n=1 Tax=Prevotella sp. P6B1 TaxID=1410613 RepID=UPI00051B6B0F|nr:hypothetical protein [Prevotella sp. P6B1]